VASPSDDYIVTFPVLWVAIEWVEAHCVIPDGFHKGEPLILSNWQLWFYQNHYRVKPNAKLRGEPGLGAPAFYNRRSQIILPQKALALDTPIATPSGWTTMGRLVMGDYVFAADGRPTGVTGKSQRWLVDTYRVKFSDGSELTACGDHEWVVDRRTPSSTYVPERLSTSEMLTAGLTDDHGARRFRVPVARPLDLPEIDLPIPPYTLGAWLGDGGQHDARITGLDLEVFKEIEGEGFRIAQDQKTTKRWQVYGLHELLRLNGLLQNKHIPAQYLRASAKQRWALLQGLMDTDGSADARQGKCEFTTTTPAIRDGIRELLHSLGIKHVCREGMGRLNGYDTRTKWRISFAARSDMPLFRIERKQARLRPTVSGHSQFLHRRIVAIEPIEPVLTQCITVDAPDHTFLAGREMIPTGNSGKGPTTASQCCLEGVGPALFAGWARAGEQYRCIDHECPCGWVYEYEEGEPKGIPWPTPLIQLTAFSQEQNDNVYGVLRPMIENGPLFDIIPKTGEEFIRLPHGGRIDSVTSSNQSRLGQRVTFVPQDEALALDTPLPTPDGWTTMGAVKVGDRLLSSDGRPVGVVKATPIQHDRICYRVNLQDGTNIVASDGHQWLTKVSESAALPAIRTTGEMVTDGRRFRIPRVKSAWRGSDWITVTSIEPVESVPVRCVAVDSEDHLFLAGEGGHVTHNTQLWLPTNKMVKVAETQRRGASGMKGRVVETSNAWDPSEDSVAQRTYNASLTRHDIFRLHPLAPAGLSFTNKAERRRILRYVYSGSPWIDIDSINAEAEEIIATDPAQAERFYGNRIVAGLGAWITETLWDQYEVDGEFVPDGTAVAGGFDGSDTDDWTAIRLETQSGYRFTPTYGPDHRPTYWNPAEWGGSIPRSEVSAAMSEIASKYRLRRFYADPRDWRTEIGEWALAYGDEVVFEWTTGRIDQMFLALKRYRNDLSSGRNKHDGDKVAREHVINARMAAKPGQKYILVKPDSHRKIDIAMADTLAHEAAADLSALGPDAWRPARTLSRAVGTARSY